MNDYIIEPWPSTYEMIEEIEPKKIEGSSPERQTGAFRSRIPPRTIEPPQIHLLAGRDGLPFQELLTDFDKDFLVTYLDVNSAKRITKSYYPGQDIEIPMYQIHWLMNKHNTALEFTCEYSPHPWDGDNDEPEFRDLPALLRFVEERGLMNKVIEASRNI